MSNIKLIIDIPEYLYDAIMVNRFGIFSNAPCEVIRYGTPIQTVTNAEEAKIFNHALDMAFSQFDANVAYSGDKVLSKIERLKIRGEKE